MKSIKLSIVVLYSLFLTTVANASGLTATLAGTGGTSLTFTWNPTARTLALSGGAADFNSALYALDEDGEPGTGPGIAGAFTAVPQTLNLPVGSDFVWVWITRFGVQVGDKILLGDVTYSHQFAIAANTWNHKVTYKVYQNGTLVLTYDHGPGSGAATMSVNGLANDDPLTVVQEHGAYVANAEGIPVWIEGEVKTVVGGGVPHISSSEAPPPTPLLPPPSGTASPSSVRPPPVIPPSTPTPPTPTSPPSSTTPPSAPTASPKGGNNTPIGIPYSPSGTGGLNKESFEDGINKLITGMSALKAETANTGDAVVDAVNASRTDNANHIGKLIESLEKGATAAHNNAVRTQDLQKQTNDLIGSTADKVIKGQNNLSTTVSNGVDGIRSDLTKANDTSAKILSALTGVPVGENTPTQPSNADRVAAWVTTASEKASQAEAVINARNIPEIDPDANTSDPGTVMTFNLLGREFNIDPVARFPHLFQMVKQLITWAVVLFFFYWLWTFIAESYNQWLSWSPAKANTQTVVGAVPFLGLPLAVLVSVAIMTVMLGAPVLLFAVIDNTVLGVQITAASVDPRSLIRDTLPSGLASAVLYLVDASIPVSTLLVAVSEWFLLRKAALAIGAGVNTFLRAIPI